MPNLGQNRRFLEPCDLAIWHMTLKNNRAPLQFYFKLCASFHSHWWIQTWLTVQKRPIWVKFDDFEACDLAIWHMTLKNNRAPLLCYFKLRASFRSHWWIQTGVTVQKRPIWVEFDNFWSRVTLKLDGWPWKAIGHLFNAISSFGHHFVAMGDFKLEIQSGTAQFGSKSTIFRAVWPCNLTDDLEKQQGTSSKQHQAVCIISSSYVNSNWSYIPETVKLGFDLCDLDLLHGPYFGHW